MNSTFEDAKFDMGSFDFIFSLGVLHHMDNILDQLKKINSILSKDGFVLIYLYYRFDNKSITFKFIWKISEFIRKIICNLPFKIKKNLCNLIALSIYFPSSIIYRFLNKLGFNTSDFPLSYYTDKSFYVMKTDALDRFGTKVENRYLKKEIEDLLIKSGFDNIKFSDNEPFWHVLAYKKLR